MIDCSLISAIHTNGVCIGPPLHIAQTKLVSLTEPFCTQTSSFGTEVTHSGSSGGKNETKMLILQIQASQREACLWHPEKRIIEN